VAHSLLLSLWGKSARKIIDFLKGGIAKKKGTNPTRISSRKALKTAPIGCGHRTREEEGDLSTGEGNRTNFRKRYFKGILQGQAQSIRVTPKKEKFSNVINTFSIKS